MTHRTRLLTTCLATCVALLAADAAAQGVDTQSLRLRGARSQGAMLTPSARLLQPGAWEVNLTFQHEGGVMRADVPTGEVRGDQRTERINWIGSRDTLNLQLAASPFERFEFLFALPVLIDHSVNPVAGVTTPAQGAAAIGDPRVHARYALLAPEASGVFWTMQAGLSLPGGNEDFAFGERRTRAELGTALGYVSDASWQVHAYAGYESAAFLSFGDQILGDTVSVAAAFMMRHGDLQWSAEAVSSTVVAASLPRTSPDRSALELLGGARYFADTFHVDLGAGFGALDAGIVPRWRLMVSIGAHGVAGGRRDRDADQAWSPDQRDAVLDYLEHQARHLERQTAAAEACAASCGHEATPTPEPEDPAIAWRSLQLEELDVYFETNTADMDASSRNTTRAVARLLMRSEGDVVIIGHADDRGSRELNDQLSLERARNVERALVEAGIDGRRLTVRAMSTDEPVSPATEFGRSMNRRVSFRWAD
mgnify:CR=1 FL=1